MLVLSSILRLDVLMLAHSSNAGSAVGTSDAAALLRTLDGFFQRPANHLTQSMD
jgi:hypothetical protein